MKKHIYIYTLYIQKYIHTLIHTLTHTCVCVCVCVCVCKENKENIKTSTNIIYTKFE